MKKFNRDYRYHHMGIPADKIQPNERYSEAFKMYTSTADGDFRIQFHRFDANSPLHPMIKELPHVAIQVDDLLSEIKGREILLGPYEPIKGYKVAIINDRGAPVELIETLLTPEELWGKAETQDDLNTDGLEMG